MAKQIELTIPKPCHEDWGKMTEMEKGRFCGSCQKQVMDFTNMSDSQLIAFFKKESSGSVCGRFMPDQLDRSMDIPKKRIPWVKYFFQFTLPLFLTSLKANAQGKVVVKKTETKAVKPSPKKCGPDRSVMMGDVEAIPLKGDTVVYSKPVRMGMIATPYAGKATKYKMIKGTVVNTYGNPVPQASIMIKGSQLGAMANESGEFYIHVPIQETVTLEVSHVGYDTKEMQLVEENKTDGKKLTIQLEIKKAEEVVVVGYGTIKGRITIAGGVGVRVSQKSLEKTKVLEVPVETNLSLMQVYPNPLPSGSAININCEKMEEEYYTLQVLTLSGQQVHVKEIWIDKDARVLNLPMPSIAAGMYMIVMTNKESKKNFTQKIVIQ